MTDAGSVGAAYAIVLGGLVLYVASIARRLRDARRTARALEHERRRDTAAGAEAPPSGLTSQPSEPVR